MTDEEARAKLEEMEAQYKQKHGRYWQEWKKGINHFNIPTTKRRILQFCRDSQMSYGLQDLICLGLEHPEYMMRLAVFSWQVYFVFQLVYEGKDGKYKKLPANRYADVLFMRFTKSPDEIRSAFVSEESKETVFRIYKAVCDALCPMIAHTGDARFWPSYVAYLVNYIIEQQGDVPPPDVEVMMVPYPRNYPRPWAEEFLPYEISI